MTMCIIFNQDDRDAVAGGEDKGYLNGSQLQPVRRQGGGTNPDPCYIVNAAVQTNEDFATAWPYVAGLPQKDSADPTFPPPYAP
jgi:hypothetical protein